MAGKQTTTNDSQVEENKNLENEDAQKQTDNTTGSNEFNVDSQNVNEQSTENANSSSEKTFTQEDVNRMMAREKEQGRNSVYNKLGIDPNDNDSIELIKAILSAKNGQVKDDSDNDEDTSSKNDEHLVELERRATIAEAKAEAMVMGVKPQFVDDVVTLASAKIAEQEGAEFKTVIGDLKQKYPLWFGTEEDSSNVGQRGTGSSINSDSGSKGSDAKEGIGKRLAAQRKPSTKKNFSYWGKN